MAKPISKDLNLEDVEEVVQEFVAKVRETGIAFNEDKIRGDVKKRVADMNGLSVEDWEKKFTAASTPVPEPVKEKTAKEKAKEVAERVKRVKETASSVDGTYFWSPPEIQAVYETWMKLRLEAGIVQNLLVVGPSGSGKTEGLKRLAAAHGMPFYKVDCAAITTTDKWVGQKNITIGDKGPETRFQLSEHLRWLGAIDCEPGLLIYDEITRLHPSLLNYLIPILDGSQEVWVPDLDMYAKVHPQTIIAATANIGAQFAGTYGLDVALHDRFSVIQERAFPPRAEEIIVLQKRTGIDEKSAATLVDIGINARQKHEAGLVDRPVSTRALIDAAYWVAAGMSVFEACETTFVKKFSPEGGGNSQRMAVRLIVQGKAGTK
jgi:nitric oxide reductase NorQ protein